MAARACPITVATSATADVNAMKRRHAGSFRYRRRRRRAATKGAFEFQSPSTSSRSTASWSVTAVTPARIRDSTCVPNARRWASVTTAGVGTDGTGTALAAASVSPVDLGTSTGVTVRSGTPSRDPLQPASMHAPTARNSRRPQPIVRCANRNTGKRVPPR